MIKFRNIPLEWLSLNRGLSDDSWLAVPKLFSSSSFPETSVNVDDSDPKVGGESSISDDDFDETTCVKPFDSCRDNCSFCMGILEKPKTLANDRFKFEKHEI